MITKNKVILFGGVLIDTCFNISEYPAAGQDSLIQSSFSGVGGCSLNVAVTLKNLGTEPYIVSTIGDDENGQSIVDYVESLSLPTEFLSEKKSSVTGYCLVMIDQDGQRTFFTHKGCEADPPSLDLTTSFSESVGAVFITGYYLLQKETADLVLELSSKLRALGALVFFDPGPLVGQIEPKQLSTALSLSHWITPNIQESKVIEDIVGTNIAKLADGNKHFGDIGVILKNGAAGVQIYSKESTCSYSAPQVASSDTNGAGDSFAGGLIHALINQQGLDEAIRLASGCGAFTTTIEGSHGHFTKQQIEKLLDSQKV